MDSHRRRTPAQVVDLAEGLRRQLGARVLSAAALESILGQFKFRDQLGGTWTRGPLTGSWYLHQQGRWVMNPIPPQGPLDGPADLGILEKARADAGEAPAAMSKPRGKSADPAAYFQQAVGRVAGAYDAGAITSDVAEAQLQELYAVDASATAWMLGVQSRAWHTYDGDQWRRSARALDRSALVESPEGGAVELGASAAQKIRRFLSRTARIPEPVVPEWSPPAGHPEPVVTCPHCGALNVGEVGACVSCERPLAPVKQPPPVVPASAIPSVPAAPPVSTPPPPPAAPVAAPAAPAPQPPPAQAAPAAASAPVSTGASRKNSRLRWFLGGCLLTAACIVIAAVVIFGLSLAWNSL